MSKTNQNAPTRRFLVILNPIAGRRRQVFLEKTLDNLRAAGLDLIVEATTARGDAEAIARRVANGAEDVDAVIAAGGDGTINEVANGLVGSDMPLGIIPMGTANVLASELDISPWSGPVSDVLINGVARPIRMGDIDGRRFLMMAGIGYDARVVARIDLKLKYRWGKAAYGLAGLLEWLEPPRAPFHVVVDGESRETAWAIIANGRRYAGKYIVAPMARLDAPSMTVCLMPGTGKLDMLRYLAAIGRGRLDREKDVTFIEARDILIPDAPHAMVEIDGDFHGAGPVRISLADEVLNLIQPA
ncbi:diacylglycerol kinase family protein [Iodidimonas sp. SYSU 1G8]|uniref:diacylglycerol/lipid kinase family protein n=1 Tax=Iodidimonas sp. SYSU 1G8 TaxID=3133967 RepID=UPI0031FF3E55